MHNVRNVTLFLLRKVRQNSRRQPFCKRSDTEIRGDVVSGSCELGAVHNCVSNERDTNDWQSWEWPLVGRSSMTRAGRQSMRTDEIFSQRRWDGCWTEELSHAMNTTAHCITTVLVTRSRRSNRGLACTAATDHRTWR